MKLTMTLPWPSAKLNPNARVHWATLAREKKKARQSAWVLTQEAKGRERAPVQIPEAGPLMVTLAFYPPTNRHRDLDNLLASMKASLDGMAEALGVNDSRFGFTLRLQDKDISGKGAVAVEVTA